MYFIFLGYDGTLSFFQSLSNPGGRQCLPTSAAPPVFTVSLFQGCSVHLSPAVSNSDRKAGLQAVLEAVRGSAGVGVQQPGALLSLFLWVLNGNFTGSRMVLPSCGRSHSMGSKGVDPYL